jgi:hypothetical protein
MIFADWSVESGGGAPVIDAEWEGWIDLRKHPTMISGIAEASAFEPLAQLLLALNAPDSPCWTSKCDLWSEPSEDDPAEGESQGPESASTACCYIDLLPAEGILFQSWGEAEAMCRRWAAWLDGKTEAEGEIELVVRSAATSRLEGFGITVYLSACGADSAQAALALSGLMAVFSRSCIDVPPAH